MAFLPAATPNLTAFVFLAFRHVFGRSERNKSGKKLRNARGRRMKRGWPPGVASMRRQNIADVRRQRAANVKSSRSRRNYVRSALAQPATIGTGWEVAGAAGVVVTSYLTHSSRRAFRMTEICLPMVLFTRVVRKRQQNQMECGLLWKACVLVAP